MPSPGELLNASGMTIVMIGFMIEVVAFAAMSFYPVRRALPVKSPIVLQTQGCFCFYVGVSLVVLGYALK